mmetsp:Transcript_24159/g.43298  ORF Transcript_24159/g.43298 Transcript_24159/m.43298 type:complete len:212 (-) Transcript_24159:412-1047(-)
MNLDFCLKLLPSPALDQISLGHNLDSILLIRIQRRDLINLRKSSLAQQLPTSIFMNRVSIATRTLSVLHNRNGWFLRRRFPLADGRNIGTPDNVGMLLVLLFRRRQRLLLHLVPHFGRRAVIVIIPVRSRSSHVTRTANRPSQHIAGQTRERLVLRVDRRGGEIAPCHCGRGRGCRALQEFGSRWVLLGWEDGGFAGGGAVVVFDIGVALA